MSEVITDGTGKGYDAKVDNTNRLEVRGVTQTGNLESVLVGEGFVLSSGTVTLTGTGESGVLYYQNAEDDNVVILTRYNIGIGKAVSATDSFATIKVYASNVTGMSGGSGNAAVVVNSNIGSSKTLVTTNSERGLNGAGILGNAGVTLYVPTERTTFIDLEVAIPKGSAMGWSITPPAGNTSMPCSFACNVHIAQGL